jgi:hypothetical protein
MELLGVDTIDAYLVYNLMGAHGRAVDGLKGLRVCQARGLSKHGGLAVSTLSE